MTIEMTPPPNAHAHLQLLRMDKPAEAVVSAEEREERRELLTEPFELARRGQIPRDRPLHANEPSILNERNLQCILLRAGGMVQRSIAHIMGYTEGHLSAILGHPDACYILDRMAAIQGAGILDIEQRLQELSPKAVDAIEGLFNAYDKDEMVVAVPKARLGFALLERNGFGRKRHVEVDHRHTHDLAPLAAGHAAITRALSESRQLNAEEVEYVDVSDSALGAPGRVSAQVGTGLPPDNDQEHQRAEEPQDG